VGTGSPSLRHFSWPSRHILLAKTLRCLGNFCGKRDGGTCLVLARPPASAFFFKELFFYKNNWEEKPNLAQFFKLKKYKSKIASDS
jgi:hypothetical protein